MKTPPKNIVDELLDSVSPLEQSKTDARMMLAAKIANAMKAKNWKNKDLLKAVGKDNPSVISKWLSGTHNFTLDTLVELEHALNVKLLDLEQKREKEQPISYKLSGIEIVESCLLASKTTLPGNRDFHFDIHLEHKMNVSKKLIVVVPTISILAEKGGAQLGLFKSSCIYHVEKLEEYLNEETNELSLPGEFIETLNAVSTSTTRGMMFSFFRGTILHNAILPIIKPQKLKPTISPASPQSQ